MWCYHCGGQRKEKCQLSGSHLAKPQPHFVNPCIASSAFYVQWFWHRHIWCVWTWTTYKKLCGLFRNTCKNSQNALHLTLSICPLLFECHQFSVRWAHGVVRHDFPCLLLTFITLHSFTWPYNDNV